MPDIRCERKNNTLVVKLARDKANALNGSMVEALNAAVDEAARDEGIRGLVLASDLPGIFSTGFDVLEVFKYDRETMTIFLSRFIDLYESLYLLPKPVVAALSGHTYAGGAMLAVTADLRVMARGRIGFALNEVNLGLALPPGFVRMLAGAVGLGYAREIILAGEALTPERALEIGLVHELTDPEHTLQRAIERCEALTQKPAAAFAANKRALREVCGRWNSDSEQAVLEEFIVQWFSSESRARREALAASLSTRKTGD